jgi:creatinine amidohydrolase
MAEHHMAFGGTFTFDIPTYQAVLASFLTSIRRHGFRRVFIVNGHGGNIAALNAFLPDFARETSLQVLATTYFELSAGDLAQFLEDQKRVHHACEVETSMMMVVIPEHVKTERLGEAYGMLGLDAEKVLRGPPSQFHNFKSITPSGVIGDARRASADKGKRLLGVCAEGLAAALKNPRAWG